MKKCLALLLITVVLITSLTACGTRRLVGTWHATIEGVSGQMTLNKDGTGEMITNGITRVCTWTVEKGKLTVTQDFGDQQYIFLDRVTYEVKDTTLTVTSMSGNTLIFTKK